MQTAVINELRCIKMAGGLAENELEVLCFRHSPLFCYEPDLTLLFFLLAQSININDKTLNKPSIV